MAPPPLPSKSKGKDVVVVQTKLYPLFSKPTGTSRTKSSDANGKRTVLKKAKHYDSDDDDSDDEDDNLPLSMLAKHPPSNKPYNRTMKRQRPVEGNLAKDVKMQTKKPRPPKSSDERVDASREMMGRAVDLPAQSSFASASRSNSSSNSTMTARAAAATTKCKSSIGTNEDSMKTDPTENSDDGDDNGPTRVSLSPTNRRSRRIFSDSAMDFVPPEQPSRQRSTLNTSNNVLTRLVQRSTYGTLLCRGSIVNGTRRNVLHEQHTNPQQNEYSSAKCPTWTLPSTWKTPSWVSLALGHVKKIDHVACDEAGVLLAVATDKVVSIYEFDMVRAADMQGRRDRARDCHDSEWKIPPIIQLFTPSSVSKLMWNPFHPDELMVGLRVGGKVQIYNVERVAQWLSKDPGNQRSLPPKKTYRTVDIHRNDGSISDMLFVDKENILVSTSNAMVYRYKFMKQSSAIAMLVWRYQASATVTTMAQIGTTLAVLGMACGQLCLLDWTQYSRERSFSNDQRPKILQRFIPHERLAAPREDILLGKRMGIRKIQVDSSNVKTSPCEALKHHWGRCRVTWVTKCGWLLSMVLESPTLQGQCRVHHASPRVVYRNSEGEMIDTERKSWSLPQSTIGVHLSNNAICFVDVPGVTNVLSHHDKFVLDGQPNMIRSKKRALVLYTHHGKQNISLPKSIKQIPQALEVHPSSEWILLGEGNRLHILSCRGQ